MAPFTPQAPGPRRAASISGIRRHQAGSRAPGFTLTELLIVSVVGVVLISSLALLILSYTRSRERIEAITRLQDQWGRVQFLLDQEIQEARATTISSVTVPSSCPSQASSAAVLVLSPPDVSLPIIYYRSSDMLRRCGAQVDVNGLLTSTVSDRLILRNVSAFSVDLSDSESPRYTLTLTDGHGFSYTNGSQPSGGISRVRPIQ